MITAAPPPTSPTMSTGGDDGLGRLRMRLMQTTATVATIVGTGWFCTLGAIPAIIALMVAKHVLVAILLLGLGVDQPASK